jgi:putative DNA primase/helicase
MKLQHDGLITLSTGVSRKSKKWTNQKIALSDFVEKLSQTTRTPETVADYRAMTKDQQDDRKDVGGFVAGYLKEGRRLKGNVEYRSVITLDVDYAQPGTWESIIMLDDYFLIVYSTHKHTRESMRLRILIPLSRNVLPDEYQAVARKIAADFGIEMFDDTTYEPERLMYWPSTPTDGDYIFDYQDGEWLNPDEVLATYDDWKDTGLWPVSSRQKTSLETAVNKKQADPTEKEGRVGLFCRSYSISEAIETFLSETYLPCDVEDRYTYAQGSTFGGLVVYDDLFAYSHHSTDPASGKLCNAFDLVRLHKFGELDRPGDEGSKSPSYRAMIDFMKNDDRVLEAEQAERQRSIEQDFGGSERVNPRKLFFRDEKFIPAYMADWFLQKHDVFVMNGEIYLFKDGVYVKDQRTFEHEATKALGVEFQSIRVSEALKYLKNMAPFLTAEEAVDTGNVLNLKNGLLDLDTLELKSHTPEFRTIIQLPVAYNPDADTSVIDEYFKRVMPEDTIPVVQEYIGYCFLPTMKYEGSLILHGEGGNGKGTLIEMIENLIGKDNFSNVSFEDLTESRFAVAQLFGKLANLNSDIHNQTLESTAVFKQVVSGDMMQAEFKYMPPFSFRNRAKLIYSANEPPTTKDNTDGFHRKLMLVPFPTKFNDHAFREKLFTEEAIQALLLRSLQGMKRLVAQGKFSDSETIAESKAEYRRKSDTAAHFFYEHCVFGDDKMIGKQELYNKYRNICDQWGHKALSQTKFNTRLKALHPEVVEYRSTLRYWKGICLEYDDFLT